MQVRLFICTLLLLISGCTYNSKLSTPLDANINTESAKAITLAIDARGVSGSKVIATPGLVTLTVDYGDALLELIRQKSLKNFKNVKVVGDSTEKPNSYDYILTVKTSTGGMCGGASCYLQTLTSIDVRKNQRDRGVLLAENFSDQYAWQQPGSAVALGIISGLTLCAICPITGPIGVNIEGDELGNQVSMSNDRIASRISDILRSSEFLEKHVE